MLSETRSKMVDDVQIWLGHLSDHTFQGWGIRPLLNLCPWRVNFKFILFRSLFVSQVKLPKDPSSPFSWWKLTDRWLNFWTSVQCCLVRKKKVCNSFPTLENAGKKILFENWKREEKDLKLEIRREKVLYPSCFGAEFEERRYYVLLIVEANSLTKKSWGFLFCVWWDFLKRKMYHNKGPKCRQTRLWMSDCCDHVHASHIWKLFIQPRIFISICHLHETKSDLNFDFNRSIELFVSECCF